jgi:hypothetical protein
VVVHEPHWHAVEHTFSGVQPDVTQFPELSHALLGVLESSSMWAFFSLESADKSRWSSGFALKKPRLPK